MDVRQANRILAWICAIGAVLAGTVFARGHWLPGVDFDLIGFFWLLQNLPRLFVFVVALFLAGMAVTYWSRSL